MRGFFFVSVSYVAVLQRVWCLLRLRQIASLIYSAPVFLAQITNRSFMFATSPAQGLAIYFWKQSD